MGVALSDIGKVIHLPDVLVAQVIDRYSIADYKWGHDIHRKEEVVSKPTSTIKN